VLDLTTMVRNIFQLSFDGQYPSFATGGALPAVVGFNLGRESVAC
jgi:hypothetical protein